MRLAVIGATGGIGRHVVDRALADGHEVTALVRDPAGLTTDDHVTPVVGDITDADAVAHAVEGVDGVIWAVGPTSNTSNQPAIFEAGARNLVAAMKRHSVRRVVALSGAGITLEGEHKPLGGRLISAVVGVLARHVVEAKRREYEVFTATDLDWTLVRPPRVVDGPPTGRILAGQRLAGRSVTQADLAEFMVRELVEAHWVRQAPYVAGLAR